MKRLELSNFLKDMTYNSKYKFLEEGKDDDELQAIAEKRGLVLPAKDLAIFSCIFAFVDKENKNGCTLERAEVESSLNTLVGKAIDFDHLREKIVGHWLDAEIVDDKIIAYGAFFKGNLEEDYAIIKELMEEGILAISFEAYGVREFSDDKSYDLKSIEFSGGALLIKTNPAFEGTKVLECSNIPEDLKLLQKEYENILKELEVYA